MAKAQDQTTGTDPSSASDAGDGESQKVKPLTFELPIWIALDQAVTRNYTEIFEGTDAEEKCKAYALERSERLGRKVAIVGPLDDVAEPPEEPVARLRSAKKADLNQPADQS